MPAWRSAKGTEVAVRDGRPMRWEIPLLVTVILVACHTSGRETALEGPATGSRYLFVWAGDADKRETDFLAVIDVDPQSTTYASVVSTVPVGIAGTVPHHTEYEMPPRGVLWANGFAAGQTFRFDLVSLHVDASSDR